MINRRGFLQSLAAVAVAAPAAAEAVSTFTPTWDDGCNDYRHADDRLPPGWKAKSGRGHYVIPQRSPYELAVGDILTFDFEGNLKRVETLDEHSVGVLLDNNGLVHLLNGTGEIRMFVPK